MVIYERLPRWMLPVMPRPSDMAEAGAPSRRPLGAQQSLVSVVAATSPYGRHPRGEPTYRSHLCQFGNGASWSKTLALWSASPAYVAPPDPFGYKRQSDTADSCGGTDPTPPGRSER